MQVTGLPEVLLNKSASVRGFFVTSHAKHFKSHFSRLLSQWESGELKITLDSKQFRYAAMHLAKARLAFCHPAYG